MNTGDQDSDSGDEQSGVGVGCSGVGSPAGRGVASVGSLGIQESPEDTSEEVQTGGSRECRSKTSHCKLRCSLQVCSRAVFMDYMENDES